MDTEWREARKARGDPAKLQRAEEKRQQEQQQRLAEDQRLLSLRETREKEAARVRHEPEASSDSDAPQPPKRPRASAKHQKDSLGSFAQDLGESLSEGIHGYTSTHAPLPQQPSAPRPIHPRLPSTASSGYRLPPISSFNFAPDDHTPQPYQHAVRPGSYTPGRGPGRIEGAYGPGRGTWVPLPDPGQRPAGIEYPPPPPPRAPGYYPPPYPGSGRGDRSEYQGGGGEQTDRQRRSRR